MNEFQRVWKYKVMTSLRYYNNNHMQLGKTVNPESLGVWAEIWTMCIPVYEEVVLAKYTVILDTSSIVIQKIVNQIYIRQSPGI